MREDLKKLLDLQNLDLRIRELEKEKEDRTCDLEALQEKIKEGEKIVEEEKECLRKEQVQIKTLELQVEEKKGLSNKYEQQLFQIKSNKEYQALLQEIEGLKADIRVLEDKMLEFMEEAEEEKRKMETVEADLEQARKKYQDEAESAKKEFDQIDREIDEIKNKRIQLAGSVEEELLEKYERIFSHKPDEALVAVVSKTCQGCNMQLTTQVVNDLKKGEVIHYCENCGCLIYLPE